MAKDNQDDQRNQKEAITLVPPDSKEEGDVTKITVSMSVESYNALLRIQTEYRSPTISHTVRLMIEDKIKSLES